MGLFLHHTVKLGPLRLTFSGRGVSASLGAGPLRVGRSRGRSTTTVRVPGTGWTWRSSSRR